jgi:hypothetical protein
MARAMGKQFASVDSATRVRGRRGCGDPDPGSYRPFEPLRSGRAIGTCGFTTPNEAYTGRNRATSGAHGVRQ